MIQKGKCTNMKKAFVPLIFVSLLFWGCKKNKNNTCPEPNLDCTGVSCLLTNYNFNFRVVDKITGTDLVFGPSPRYNTSDIKLYKDKTLTQPLSLSIDNTQKLFKTSFASQKMFLVIAGATTYDLSADFKQVDCCTYTIKNLTENGQEVCTCCGDAIQIKAE